MTRVLIAAGFLALYSASAFAAACTAPIKGLPSSDSFETILNLSSTSVGSLDGNSGGYQMCDPTGTSLLPISSSANNVPGAVIPFTPPAAEFLQIAVSSEVGETGSTFDLTVNGTTYTNTDSLVLDLSSVLNTLGITEHYSAGAVGDELSVSIQKFNFIPEPATLSLLGFGAAGLAALRRRQRPG